MYCKYSVAAISNGHTVFAIHTGRLLIAATLSLQYIPDAYI